MGVESARPAAVTASTAAVAKTATANVFAPRSRVRAHWGVAVFSFSTITGASLVGVESKVDRLVRASPPLNPLAVVRHVHRRGLARLGWAPCRVRVDRQE